MNTAHWHLMLNHIPVVGIIGGTVILLAGFILKNNLTIRRTGLGLIIFSVLFAIPAYLTGEGAEEIAENIAGITSSRIENHEDVAKVFLIVAICLGILAIITSVMDWMKNKLTPIFYVLVLINGIGASIFAKPVSKSGGEIRHTEISNAVQPSSAGIENKNSDHDDAD